MHPNEELLTQLFQRLNQHDPNGMADCYSEDATFQDIAFALKGKKQIHAMWDMACSVNEAGVESDIAVSVKELSANDSNGRAVIVDTYTFRDKGRKVENQITSRFEFLGGKITKQTDECDPIVWADQAIGGFFGWLAGRISFVRRRKAMNKLRREHPDAF